MLPNHNEIEKWTDEKLSSVISSGEKINWNCGMDESQDEIDYYVESIYSELEKRNSNLSTTKF